MKKIIDYFSNKHILTNFIVIAVFIGAGFFWNMTNKEELPNITFDFAGVNVSYPGATAEEVEYFVTQEIEESLSGIDGIEEVKSTSSAGSASIRIYLTPHNPNRDEVMDEIKDAVNNVKLPDDIEDDPRIWEFKSSKKAIIDIMLFYDGSDLMTEEERRIIQYYTDDLEDRLLRLSTISEVNINGDINDYIEIRLDPKKLINYNISISQVISSIKSKNLKQPIGVLDDDASTKLVIDAELNEIDLIKNTTIQSSFEGFNIKLKDVADVAQVFEDPKSFFKVNGSEAIRINVTKSSNAGIIEAVDQVRELINTYSNTALKGSKVKLVLLDDESADVRNRLRLISINGLIGFTLIIIILFIFLNARSALWVAMGIPFTFGFTMITASLMGHTINNITLAAVIIVMGMVVDDAIVVAENVSRLRAEGKSVKESVIKGTVAVLLPIVGSITTTCVAFIPLYFFPGRFGMMVKYIPPIIFLMLGGSLFEALIILPSHLRYKFPRWMRIVFSFGLILVIEKLFDKNHDQGESNESTKKQVNRKMHWFVKIEDLYGNILKKILRFKWVLFIIFIATLLYAGLIFTFKMKYTMFPREETTSVRITGTTPHGTSKYKTEELVRPVEDIFIPYLGKEVIGVRNGVGQTRWGGRAKENTFTMNVEIVPKDKRKKSVNTLISEWEVKLADIEGFEELKISKSRFGGSSGSPIEILIKENDDETRFKVAAEIENYLKHMPAIYNAETEYQFNDPQITVKLKRDIINRINISPEKISTTLRTVLSGNNIYDISKNNKETDVIITVNSNTKKNIESILEIPIENSLNYLVPLKTIVNIKKTTSPSTITRIDGKRVINVYADLKENKKSNVNPQNNNWKKNNNNSGKNKTDDNGKIDKKLDLPEKMTALEVAVHLEKYLFPDLMNKYPSTEIEFSGEIKDSRETGTTFVWAIILIIVLIYLILALTLNSLIKPFIILLSIPFGFAGIIIALQLHGMMIFGFFSIIGALGLAGVVVNDSIVLLAKLNTDYPKRENQDKPHIIIADITKTRLRAVLLTTITTVAGLLPTAYGIAGYDSMLAEMMLTMAWGLIFGTVITLVLVPSIYCAMKEFKLNYLNNKGNNV